MASPPHVPTPFQKSLTTSMMAWRASDADGRRSPMWAHWKDGLHPSLRDAAQAQVQSGNIKLHDFAAALPSSQAFAFNLFLPFSEGAAKEHLSKLVAGAIGADFRVDRIELEWVPPGRLLGEIRGDTPNAGEPATGVDAVLWGTSGGQPAAVLVEVKLTEGGFTHCGGHGSKGNQRADVCASAKVFLDDPTRCYLQRPARATRDRRYWEIFSREDGGMAATFPGIDPAGACPFKGDMQQPMRNLAIAAGLKQQGTVAKSWFLLCAHDGNPDVPPHWTQWQSLLGAPERAPRLRASDLVSAGADAGLTDWANWMARRYRLPLRQVRYARAPSGAFLQALAPGGALAFLLHSPSVNGVALDVHFREQDHLHVYCGLTRLLDVRLTDDRVMVDAHATYRQQAPDVFRTWYQSEYAALEAALAAYYGRVEVRTGLVGQEGAVATAFGRSTDLPWHILDREAVIGYSSTPLQQACRTMPSVQRAWEAYTGEAMDKERHVVAAKLDLLGVDASGALVLIELKHSRAKPDALAHAPLQLLQYVWEWYHALPS